MFRWWLFVLTGCGRVAFDALSPEGEPTGDASCGPEQTLRACYPFDDTTLDTSGVGNHATGTLTYEDGHIGRAGRFGPGINVRVPDSPNLAITDALTVTAWVRLDTVPSGRAMIVDHNYSWGLSLGSSGLVTGSVYIGGGRGVSSTTPVAVGTWTHVAVTFDGQQLRLYVAGTEAASLSSPGQLPFDDPQGTRIGGNIADNGSSAEDPFLGAIDELGVWSEALPAARIMAAAQE